MPVVDSVVCLDDCNNLLASKVEDAGLLIVGAAVIMLLLKAADEMLTCGRGPRD